MAAASETGGSSVTDDEVCCALTVRSRKKNGWEYDHLWVKGKLKWFGSAAERQ